MAKPITFEGKTYTFPDDATDDEIVEALESASAATVRSEAMGGPLVAPEERALRDAEALAEAQRKGELTEMVYPSFLPPPPSPVAQAQEAIEAREAVASPGGEPEEPYAEAIRGFVPMLRPTRIVEQPSGERLYRDPDTGELRPPTEAEKIIESFARQPVLTESAARALAAGTPEQQVQKKVGPLEGAVIETPFQALMRAAPASVEAALTEAYRALPGPTSPLTSSGLYTRYLRGLSEAAATSESAPIRALADVPAAIATGIETVEGTRQRLAAPAQEAALRAVRGGVGALERVAGVTPGSSPLAQELGALGAIPTVPQVAIPAPAAIPDKPVSQRILEGETLADVIRSDPKSVQVYDREFGALAPLAIEATGFLLSAPLPFTPVGVVTDLARVSGATRAATKAATSTLTRIAQTRASSELASKLWQRSVGGAVRDIPSGLSLENVVQKAEKHLADRTEAYTRSLLRQDLPPELYQSAVDGLRRNDTRDLESLRSGLAQARTDLARVAPRTDLVRVSPSYAVPATLAPRVAAEAASDVRALREQARARGRTLTRAEETAARDAAVARAAQAEAKRLDELGQFQVLLDGLDTPRAWDTALYRAARAAYSPEQAAKRASVVAAEQEVARKGMDALRQFRREVEVGSRAGKTIDDIIAEVGDRELSGMSDAEIAKKVIEEAYGPERAALISRTVALTSRNLLRPGRARALHEELVRAGAIPGSATPPNFAANAVKIIMEEGVRKRVSREALDTYARQYPDSPRPALAVPGTVGPFRADALLSEKKFFENGAEEMFRLADQIPTRSAGAAPSVTEAAERLAAVARNVQQKVRLPLAAEATLLGGEVVAAPVRAYLTTRYAGLPVAANLLGIDTPYGYLRPADLQTMIDDLGGFGPSRMDVERRGMMVQDILLSAAKGFDLGRAAARAPAGTGQRKYAAETVREAARAAAQVAQSRPYAYATVGAIEEAYRRGVFADALRRGQTPEAAMTLARRSQLDYGAQDSEIIRQLAPYWAGAVSTMAAGAEFVDRLAKNPRNYSVYLRALREQQRRQDPEGLQGDLPLTRYYAPVPDDVMVDVLGRPVDVLGPEAPMLLPLDLFLGAAKTVQLGGDTVRLLVDGQVIQAALEGSVDAMDQVSERIAAVSTGLGGAERTGARTIERSGVGPTVDQTYMAILAIGRALGMEQAALRFLEPVPVRPPKSAAAFGADSYAWATRPPIPPGAGGGTFVYSSTENGQQVYYLVRPSKEGRQRIRALESLPLSDVVGRGVRAAGTALAAGVPEGALWYIGAETVEEPTRQAVEQVRAGTSP